MSQTVAGDSEGAGGSSQHPIKHFQSTAQHPIRFSTSQLPTHGQNGPFCGPIMPPYPPKHPNPNMVNGFRPPMQIPTNMQVGPMQYQYHHHPHFNTQPHNFHQMNVVAVKNENHKSNHNMQNHCNNIQYVPGGNYVATVTVQPRDQYAHQQIQQNQFSNNNQQFMANQHKYLMNPAMINPMNNVNYIPNVMMPGYKNFQFPASHFPQNPNANTNQVPRSCPSNACDSVKPGENNDINYEDPDTAKDGSKFASDSQTNSDASSIGELSPSQLSTGSLKANNSPTNTNSPISRNSSANNPSRPRTSSRNESDRSETAESCCSSLSTESTLEQGHHHIQNPHNHSHAYNNQNNFGSNQPFVNGHMQNISNFGSTNINFSNFVASQQGANSGQAKTQVMQHCNPNLVQGFRQVNTVQQVHMQSSQVQIMHQQYQYVQGQAMPVTPRVRPNMGIIPNCSMPLNLPNSPYHAGSPNVISNHSSPSLENSREHGSPIPETCAMNPQGQHPLQQQPMYPGMMESDQMVLPASHLAGMPNSGFLAPAPDAGSPQEQTTGEAKTSFPSIVVVPFGWRRLNENGKIVYVSPSGTELRSSNEVTEYLTREGTCKCGLQCPLRVEETFCFDAKIGHRMTMPNELSSSEMTKLCNHRRKLAFAFSDHLEKQAKKEDGRKKQKRKASPMEVCTPPPSTPAGNTIKQQPPTVQQQQAFMCSMQQQQQLHQPPMQQPQIRPPFQAFPLGHHPAAPAGGHHPPPPHLSQMPSPQNWSTVGGMPRMMMPPGCPPVNYQQMCATQYHAQHGCCDNHGCFPGVQGPPPQCATHHGTPKAFEGPEVQQQFCRPSTGSEPMLRTIGSSEQHCMQHTQQHQNLHHFQMQQQQAMMNNPGMMGGNIRPVYPYMGGGDPMCRMPCSHNNMNKSQNVLNALPYTSEVVSVQQKNCNSREGEKRRRNPGRGKKRAKTTESPASSSEVNPAPTAPNFGAASSEASQASTSTTTTSSHEGPSFMEDPNAYLAQQTALLNNTMAGGGAGQFSPQAPGVSPRSVIPNCTHSETIIPLSPKSLTSRSSVIPSRVASGTQSSPAIVPLPSNVPLPARVSKASSLPPTCAVECAVTTSTTTFCTATCTSVQSKSSYATSFVSSSKTLPTVSSGNTQKRAKSETSWPKFKGSEDDSNASEEILNEIPAISTSCECQTSSPHSLEENAQLSIKSFSRSSGLNKDQVRYSLHKSTNSLSPFSNNEKFKKLLSKQTSEDALSLEAAANKPLTPGPVESSMNTQSPLEMVQNIVSSIPVPSSEESPPPPPQSRPLASHQGPQFISDPMQSMQHAVPQHMIGPHVFNMAGTGGLTGVVYNPGSNGSNMLRGPAPMVVHSTGSSGTIPSGVLVSSNNNMVVVTSPFNTKGSVTAPVACSNINGVVGVQAVPQVQVQPSLGHVQPHQLQSQLQQIQPVQPVVQLVNTFATMQGPVIIQNGANIIQPASGVLSSHGGVIGTAGMISSSGPTFVTNQPLISTATLTVDSSQNSGHLSMTQVVSSASSDVSDDSLSGNRSTPVATPASTPTTPLTTPGSDTPPSSGSSRGSNSGGKRKRKRRNASTPQIVQHHAPPQPAGLMPAFIMGKQIPQSMVMSNPQLSPYGNVAGAQVATVAAVGNSAASTQGQILQPTAPQPASAINVVQMVGGHVTGPLPVQLQQPPTILLPSATHSGLIINQLSDGTFVSTDPNTGVSYPVQIQLSGSHVVGVPPTPNANQPAGVIGSLASTTSGPMVAVNTVRAPSSQPSTLVTAGTKVINISPNVASSVGSHLVNNVYDVSRNTITQASLCPTGITPSNYASTHHSISHSIPLEQQSHTDTVQRPILMNNANATVLQQKTTIVAQQTTVLAAQGGLVGTHSSVSTQTPAGAFGESDVTSSDSAGNPVPEREFPTSPTHQSAEITTTRRDDDSVSPPQSLPSTPTQDLHHINKSMIPPSVTCQNISVTIEEPHSATLPEDTSGRVVVLWAAHRGFPQWPAQLLHQAGGSVLIRWYGDHTVETIPLPSVSEFKNEAQSVARRRSRGRDALEKAMAEAKEDLMLPQISPSGAYEGSPTPHNAPASEESLTGMSPSHYLYSHSVPCVVADSLSEGGICIATSSEYSGTSFLSSSANNFGPGRGGVLKVKRKRKLL